MWCFYDFLITIRSSVPINLPIRDWCTERHGSVPRSGRWYKTEVVSKCMSPAPQPSAQLNPAFTVTQKAPIGPLAWACETGTLSVTANAPTQRDQTREGEESIREEVDTHRKDKETTINLLRVTRDKLLSLLLKRNQISFKGEKRHASDNQKSPRN